MTLYESVTERSELDHPMILDFGCGCGRMVRFLINYAAKGSIYGCDVNPDHVKWCQQGLKDVQVSAANVLPPLPYADQMFDLVYGLSIFTHLSQSNANKWLSEMHRILKPRGVLILTTHGTVTLEVIKDSEGAG